jgi:hypothetical protein
VLSLALLLGACSGRASFDEDVSFRDVERTLATGGLRRCGTTVHPDGLANQATASRTYVVAFDCDSDDTVRVVVDRFGDTEARDAAAQQFESAVRPRGDGAVWTLGPFTVFANGPRDDDVMDALTTALDDAGAR